MQTQNDIHFEFNVSVSAEQAYAAISGVKPDAECYNFCNAGWEGHVMKSLQKLIAEGVGTPQ